MAQEKAWEKEYQEKKLITGSPEPQKAVLKFLRYLKKEGVVLSCRRVLDLGSGTGRNANYLAAMGNEVFGIEISASAIRLAGERAREADLKVSYIKGDIGKPLDFPDNNFDLVLDVTSSNSLTDKERKVYLAEVSRVLKPDGHFFVRALLKEGDKNAKNLLKNSPGPDPDSYYMKELDIYEKVFSQESFKNAYGEYFRIEKLLKHTGYATVLGQKYKRNYLLAYLRKNI